jgi:hypothetical protein
LGAPVPPAAPKCLQSCAKAPSSGMYDLCLSDGSMVNTYCHLCGNLAYAKVVGWDETGLFPLNDEMKDAVGSMTESASDGSQEVGNGREKLSDAHINALRTDYETSSNEDSIFMMAATDAKGQLITQATCNGKPCAFAFGKDAKGMGIYGWGASTKFRLIHKDSCGIPAASKALPPFDNFYTSTGTPDLHGKGNNCCYTTTGASACNCGQNVDRWFLGHCGGDCMCYGHDGNVCFSGGSTYKTATKADHAPLAGAVLYLYHGTVA